MCEVNTGILRSDVYYDPLAKEPVWIEAKIVERINEQGFKFFNQNVFTMYLQALFRRVRKFVVQCDKAVYQDFIGK